MVDILGTVITACATGFGVAIGNEVWSFFKKKHSNLKELTKVERDSVINYLKKEATI
jgi:uncharacterized protein (DUF697 family)